MKEDQKKKHLSIRKCHCVSERERERVHLMLCRYIKYSGWNECWSDVLYRIICDWARLRLRLMMSQHKVNSTSLLLCIRNIICWQKIAYKLKAPHLCYENLTLIFGGFASDFGILVWCYLQHMLTGFKHTNWLNEEFLHLFLFSFCILSFEIWLQCAHICLVYNKFLSMI